VEEAWIVLIEPSQLDLQVFVQHRKADDMGVELQVRQAEGDLQILHQNFGFPVGRHFSGH
jgi:hypothetical protein